MDQIDPRTHYIHEPFDGENLERVYWANQPCKVLPWHLTNAAIVIFSLIAIGAALYAANAAAGMPV